jgi:hypothetical protein
LPILTSTSKKHIRWVKFTGIRHPQVNNFPGLLLDR